MDETLFVSFDHSIEMIVNLVDEHIDGLNDIFSRTVFTEQFSDLYFHAKVRENIVFACKSLSPEYRAVVRLLPWV